MTCPRAIFERSKENLCLMFLGGTQRIAFFVSSDAHQTLSSFVFSCLNLSYHYFLNLRIHYLFMYFSRSLDKTISTLEMELEAARTSLLGPKFMSERMKPSNKTSLQKAFVVIGINTAFSSKKRRDSLRETWMPTGSHFFLITLHKFVFYYSVYHSKCLPQM